MNFWIVESNDGPNVHVMYSAVDAFSPETVVRKLDDAGHETMEICTITLVEIKEQYTPPKEKWTKVKSVACPDEGDY